LKIKYDCYHLRFDPKDGSPYCEVRKDKLPLCMICGKYCPAKLVLLKDEEGKLGVRGDVVPIYAPLKQIEEYSKIVKVEEVKEYSRLNWVYLISIMRAISKQSNVEWERHERVREAVQWSREKLGIAPKANKYISERKHK